ncbi:anaphase promoting complex subunit 5 [Dinochytrium kinnereticum]|nr:anaphase promoting complex subunit 5 [Dinochytrium kinnereticum]
MPELAKTGDYHEAVEAARKFFDTFNPDSARDLVHNALLELAILHIENDNSTEGRMALVECIQRARQSRDFVCVLYAKAWMLELNEGKEVPTEDFLLHLVEDAEKQEIRYLECFFLVKTAEILLREGDGPDNVFFLIDRASNVEFDHSVKEMLGAIQLLKAQAWYDFGVSLMSFHFCPPDFSSKRFQDIYYSKLLCFKVLLLARNGELGPACELLLEYRERFRKNDRQLNRLWVGTALTLLLERALERSGGISPAVSEAAQASELILLLTNVWPKKPEHLVDLEIYTAKLETIQERPDVAYETFHRVLKFSKQDHIRCLRKNASIRLDIAEMLLDAESPTPAIPYLFSDSSIPDPCATSMHHPLGSIFHRSQILVARFFLSLKDPFKALRVLTKTMPAILAGPLATLRGQAWYVLGMCHFECIKEVRRRESGGDKESRGKEGGQCMVEEDIREFIEEFEEQLTRALEEDEDGYKRHDEKDKDDGASLSIEEPFDYYIRGEGELEAMLGVSESSVFRAFESAIKEFKSIESLTGLKKTYAHISLFHSFRNDLKQREEAAKFHNVINDHILLRTRFLTEPVQDREDLEETLEGIACDLRDVGVGGEGEMGEVVDEVVMEKQLRERKTMYQIVV